jgi:type IV pilus assembly protein PilB
MVTPRLRLGQLLVDAKLITEQALQEVLDRQGTDGRRLGTLLVEAGFINETQLTQILSHQLAVPWVSLLHIEFSRQLLNLVPHDVADKFCLVPIYVRHVRNQGDTLYVAMDDPSNEDGLSACREHAGLPVRAMIAPPQDIRNAIRVYYGSRSSASSRAAAQRVIEDPSIAPPQSDTLRPSKAPDEVAAAKKSEAASPTTSVAPIDTTPARPIEAAPATPFEAAIEAASPPPIEAPLPVDPTTPFEAAIDGLAPVSSRKAAELEKRIDAMLSADEAAPERAADDGPVIEATEIPIGDAAARARSDRLRAIVEPVPPSAVPPSSGRAGVPSSERFVETIPRPRGRAPRMVSLTLLDGTTIPLPAKRRPRADSEPNIEAPRPRPLRSEPPGPDEAQGLTARDLVIALRAAAQGADASEVLGSNERWESMFAALLSLMLKKHLIADWEFVEELKNMK